MPTVYLIRHGQASFGAADYDVLSALGERQSKILGEELRRRGLLVDQVHTGTLRRQRATAAACLPVAGIDVPTKEDPRWNEYDTTALFERFPSFEEATPEWALGSPRAFQALLERAMLAWSAGEVSVGAAGTWREFCDAPCKAIADLVADLGGGGTALVFTSGGVISAICASLLGLSPEAFLAVNRTMVNASITKIVYGRSGMSLVSLNEHAHFEGLNRDLLTYR
jgi:broad specificity phosphatase PhoE